MLTNDSDNFLQFNDFTNAPGNTAAPQISVNSPTSATRYASGRQRGKPLSELEYDMSSSAQVMTGSSSGQSGGATEGSGIDNANFETDASNKAGTSFLSIEYYQKFFNVDTMMVLERIVNSMVPKRANDNYLRSTIGENPDLYGPVWITISLIFSIAISGNIASYLQHASGNYHWHYNFHLVSYAASCIFIYVNLLPLALWAVFKSSLKPIDNDLENDNANYTPTLLTLMCIYGYSLAIYVPVSILWVVQISMLQWLLVVTAALLSGSVLIIVLSPALRNSKLSLPLIAVILSAHFLLAAGFMLLFFHVPSTISSITTTTTEQGLKRVQNGAEINANNNIG